MGVALGIEPPTARPRNIGGSIYPIWADPNAAKTHLYMPIRIDAHDFAWYRYGITLIRHCLDRFSPVGDHIRPSASISISIATGPGTARVPRSYRRTVPASPRRRRAASWCALSWWARRMARKVSGVMLCDETVNAQLPCSCSFRRNCPVDRYTDRSGNTGTGASLHALRRGRGLQ